MSKSPSLRRIQADIRELSLDPSPSYHASPLENDMFEWHFTIRGADGTDFEGGVYHGRILLPPEYPFKPPHIILLTPSGRFETNTKICLSFTAFHPELWQPAWGIRLLLEALIAFLPTPADGAIGSLDWNPSERKRLAKESVNFVCPKCCGGDVRTIADLLPKVDDGKSSSSSPGFAKQIAELQRLQQQNEARNNKQGAKEKMAGKGATDAESEKEEHCKDSDNGAEITANTSSTGLLTTTEKEEDDNDTKKDKAEDGNDAKPKKLADNAAATVARNDENLPSQHEHVETDAMVENIPSQQEQNRVVPEAAAITEGVMEVPPVVANIQDNVHGNTNRLSWMYDPLLNIIILLLTMICYLLVQKYIELRQELTDLYSLDQYQYDAPGLGTGTVGSGGGEDSMGAEL